MQVALGAGYDRRMSRFVLAAAGNVVVPAFLILRDKGFTLKCKPGLGAEREVWTATKRELSFVGDGPLELLGLVAIYEARGTQWQAPDDEIEAFLAEYYP